MFSAEEKTQPQGPFAKHLARIEGKIDQLTARQDEALSTAFAAHQTARTALWARRTVAPFVASALAIGVSLACAGYVYAAVAGH